MAKRVQEFIPIKEVRDGVVILKDGNLRSVLLASSINFDLKSKDEQLAILAQYQGFLNTLDFHVQLFVQSRRLDIRPYLAVLEKKAAEQPNDLLKKQTREYAGFIKSVTEEANIMSKTFFVVVPYAQKSYLEKESTSIIKSLLRRGKKSRGADKKSEAMEHFEENRSQLEQRKSIVMQGLSRMGIRTISLDTEELVELFYKMFNPGELNVPKVPGA